MGVDMKLMELKKKVPTFVGLRLDGPSMDEVMKLNRGVRNRTSKGEVHITVIYSKTPISYTARGSIDPKIEFTGKHYSLFTTQEGETCLVLEIESDAINALHKSIMEETGASYDYETYKPHITLSYDVGEDFDVKNLPKIKDLPAFYAHQEYATKLETKWGKKKAA